MTENAIAREIVDDAFRIHTTLGPGLLESVYQTSWRMNCTWKLMSRPRRLSASRRQAGSCFLWTKDGITRIVNGPEDDDHAKSPSRQKSIGTPHYTLLEISSGAALGYG
jgi:hypothetical protein